MANVHAVLHRALADAVRDGLVDRNVASLVSPSCAERPEMTTWTVTELKQFLRSVEGHRLYAAFVVLATTGMRRGEVLGLQGVDVDLAHAEPPVRRTVVVVDGRIAIGPPKSSSSRRLVALDTTTTAVLANHLQHRAGPVWVFPGEGHLSALDGLGGRSAQMTGHSTNVVVMPSAMNDPRGNRIRTTPRCGEVDVRGRDAGGHSGVIESWASGEQRAVVRSRVGTWCGTSGSIVDRRSGVA